MDAQRMTPQEAILALGRARDSRDGITPLPTPKQLRRKLLRESAFFLFFTFAMGFNLGLIVAGKPR